MVPNLFILTIPFENITSALGPSHYLQLLKGRNNNQQDKNTIISLVSFTVFTFLCRTNNTYANQLDD